MSRLKVGAHWAEHCSTHAKTAAFLSNHRMSINLKKSQILGMGISEPVVAMAAKDLGCSVMKIPFLYFGVMVGGNMSLSKAWDSTIEKLSM
ncbi:hypothetical protein Tco_0297401, partial [Tanacetum coccineum]